MVALRNRTIPIILKEFKIVSPIGDIIPRLKNSFRIQKNNTDGRYINRSTIYLSTYIVHRHMQYLQFYRCIEYHQFDELQAILKQD